MMPNVLQYPIAVAAVLRAGFIAVNVNPLYTARELEHQLHDSGAEAVIVLENFAATLQQAMAGTPVKHVVVATLGDLLGFPKGLIVNFVVRTREEDDPGLVAARPRRVQRGDRRRPVDDLRAARARAGGHRGAAVHRRHDRRRQGRHAARTAPSSPTCWRRRRGCSPACVASRSAARS